ALDRPRRWIPKLAGEKVVEVADRVPQERVYLGWPSPEIGAADEPELNLAALILSDGLSSRLTKTLVYDKKLCTEVSAFADAQEIAGDFGIIATLAPAASMAKVERSIDREIAALAKTGPTQAELDRARAKYYLGFVKNLENMGAFGGTADILNYYNVYFGDPAKVTWDVDRYNAATVASTRA